MTLTKARKLTHTRLIRTTGSAPGRRKIFMGEFEWGRLNRRKAMIHTKTIQGTEVPALGFGTYELTGDACRTSVLTALETGYRHLDTARAYENEAEVGAALAESGVLRDDIFLTSKIWFEDLNYSSVIEQVQTCLKSLQTDYLDLVLIHWPNPDIPLRDTFAALELLKNDELISQYGVSNFTPQLLESALTQGNIFCNQVEFHPLLRRRELHRMAMQHDLLLTAYSPLAQGQLRGFDILDIMATKHERTIEQVALRWLLDQPNIAAIPRSSNPEHIRANFKIWDFSLDEEDLRMIDELPDGMHQVNPEFAPAWEK